MAIEIHVTRDNESVTIKAMFEGQLHVVDIFLNEKSWCCWINNRSAFRNKLHTQMMKQAGFGYLIEGMPHV